MQVTKSEYTFIFDHYCLAVCSNLSARNRT